MTLHDDINQRGIIEHEPSFMSIFYYILFFLLWYDGILSHYIWGGGISFQNTYIFTVLSVCVCVIRTQTYVKYVLF